VPFHASLFTAMLLLQAPTPTYEQAIAEVDALSDKINLGEPVNAELNEALAQLSKHAPTLAADPESQAIRIHAQLNLARSYLADGNRELAAVAMDDLLRSTIGEELPVADFGPALVQLHAERKAALASSGPGTIEVRCKVPCRVYINEHSSAERMEGMYLGIYRVWVEAANNPERFITERVSLTESAPAAVIDFAPAPEPHIEPRPQLPRPVERIMPSSAETALVAVGASAALVGVLLLATSRGGERRGQMIGGATLTGLGGTALVIGGITLGVDEVRIGKLRGQQAMVGWRMNF
jgi:hypothetical protein